MKRVLIILVMEFVLAASGISFGWWMDRVVHAQVVATVPTISGCVVTLPSSSNENTVISSSSIPMQICTLTDASGTRHWLVVTTSSGGIAIMEDK